MPSHTNTHTNINESAANIICFMQLLKIFIFSTTIHRVTWMVLLPIPALYGRGQGILPEWAASSSMVLCKHLRLHTLLKSTSAVILSQDNYSQLQKKGLLLGLLVVIWNLKRDMLIRILYNVVFLNKWKARTVIICARLCWVAVGCKSLWYLFS